VTGRISRSRIPTGISHTSAPSLNADAIYFPHSGHAFKTWTSRLLCVCCRLCYIIVCGFRSSQALTDAVTR